MVTFCYYRTIMKFPTISLFIKRGLDGTRSSQNWLNNSLQEGLIHSSTSSGKEISKFNRGKYKDLHINTTKRACYIQAFEEKFEGTSLKFEYQDSCPQILSYRRKS